MDQNRLRIGSYILKDEFINEFGDCVDYELSDCGTYYAPPGYIKHHDYLAPEDGSCQCSVVCPPCSWCTSSMPLLTDDMFEHILIYKVRQAVNRQTEANELLINFGSSKGE